MRFANRIEHLPPYLFVGINRKIAAKRARGEEVINFGAGDPDIATPPHIVDELCRASREPDNHRYPETAGLPILRQAIADWYSRRFGINLDPDREIVPLIGAKEGVAHISLCLINENDIALITDPAYPVYAIGTALCGGQTYRLPINEKNHFLPDLENIPAEILKRSRVLWLNFPNNPTGAVAPLEFFNRAVEFAVKNDIIICHDGPYTEVAFDGYRPVSFLQAKGALDCGIEFHSFSKTYNMAGWRIGMACGNSKVIDALRRLKTNLDSGIPQAIQYMAVAALNGPQEVVLAHNRIYQARRDRIVDVLHKIGFQANLPRAGLYIWVRCPEGYTSVEFAESLLDQVSVVVTPGTGYGPGGEGFIRLSLTLPDDKIEKGLTRLNEWKSKKKD